MTGWGKNSNITSNYAKTSSNGKKKKNNNGNGKIIAKSDEVDEKKIPKWKKDLQKLDGQDEDGKGGGRLSKAAGVISQYQGYRDAAKWKGDSTPNTIREGATDNDLAQGDEIGNYDAWLRRQNKNKKNNSNYE